MVPGAAWFVSRDREEELADIIRAAAPGSLSDRTAVVFQRPLPYLYLARTVFEDARVPYQAARCPPARRRAVRGRARSRLRGRHVGSEPCAADRSAGLAALAVRGRTSVPLDAADVAALDAHLREIKYLGGWDRLESLAASDMLDSRRPPRQRRVARGIALCVPPPERRGSSRRASKRAPPPSQITGLRRLHHRGTNIVRRPGPDGRDHSARARAAILGALSGWPRRTPRTTTSRCRSPDWPAPCAAGSKVRRSRPRTGDDGVSCSTRARRLTPTSTSCGSWASSTATGPSVRGAASSIRCRSSRSSAGRTRPIGSPPRGRGFRICCGCARRRVSVSTFTLEDDAIVSPSPFLEESTRAGLPSSALASAGGRDLFVQEALRTMPVAGRHRCGADARAGVASGWLELRGRRIARRDPASTAPRARAPQRSTPSATSSATSIVRSSTSRATCCGSTRSATKRRA